MKNSAHRNNLTENFFINVILPIYKDVGMTEACIESAMDGVLNIPGTQLIAINDGSPDSGMDEMLERISYKYPQSVKVYKNDANLGFVKTVNRGFEISKGKDVVLLNSDVIVSGNWLQRLKDVCYSEENIGTVTPLSNNATICSFPAFLAEQELPCGWQQHEIDKTFSLRNIPPIDAPTGVGFCMYIKAECLKSVGMLNYDKFGRGYGEENDFCQRAISLGWRNVITSNVFAYHKGGVSFSSEKNALVEKAMKTLDELHPNYHKDVQLFIKADTLKAQRLQRSIDLIRLSTRPICLAITHELGGGVKQHTLELAEYLSDQMHTVIVSPKENATKISLSFFPLENGDELIFHAEAEYSQIVQILNEIRASFIHFHHTHGLNPKIWSLPSDLNIKYAMTVHDFYWINANPTLTNSNGVHIPGQITNLNNPLYPLPYGVTEEKWRDSLAPLIENAELLIFPSMSTMEIFSPFYSNKNRFAVYHPDENRRQYNDFSQTILNDNIKILALGALGREKGADLLDSLAEILKKHSCNITLLGYAYRPLVNVTTTGPYDTKQTNLLIKEQMPNVFLFTALWPETFSYTLSYAMAYGAPIIAPNVGAFSERLSRYKNALLFNHVDTPENIAKDILTFLHGLKNDHLFITESLPNAEYPESFYRKTFIQRMSKEERPSAGLLEDNIVCSSSNYFHAPKLTKKEVVLVILWNAYQSKLGYWIGRFIPFNVKRTIKRVLSRKSMAEITHTKIKQ